MKNIKTFAGVAVGSFMAVSSAVQAQPVPELYGREGIPDNNQKINCVREALYHHAGGKEGMLQSTYKDGSTTVFQFETSNADGPTMGWVKKNGNSYVIDIYPIGKNQAGRQKVLYDYILQCDPKAAPAAP